MPSTYSSRGRSPSQPESPGSLQFSILNWILLAAGLLAVIVGFAVLARGSTVAAPLLLMLGFLVLIPLGIIK